MIRFVDLRHVSKDIGNKRFAFWDTVTDSFVSDVEGDQAWETFKDFRAAASVADLDRFERLAPDWAKEHP